MSLETEIINAQNTYLKLQQDIAELNAKRSKLQNELEEKKEENRARIEIEYAAHSEKISKESVEIKAQREETLAFCENAKAEALAGVNAVKEQTMKISSGFAALDQSKAQFEDHKTTELKRISQADEGLRIREQNLSIGIGRLNNDNVDLVLRVKAIDNKEFQAQWLIDENKRLISEITTQQDTFGRTLKNISDERKLISSEKEEIMKLLGELKQKEAALAQASTVGEDIAEYNKKKVEVEALIKQNEELSKATAKKQEELREQSISLDEQKRALLIDMRKNDEKIQTIQKLREEMKKNA